ncbi:MAG: hypothetical protein IRZ28_12175 [Steroidobacteraceae bacterium]|nr:hypothetical protein [Steroidobacteraceae bacterium]
MPSPRPTEATGSPGAPTETRADAPRPRNRPNQDEDRPPVEGPGHEEGCIGQEPRGVQPHIADDDKLARTGTTDEHVRDTPPAGEWNDTTYD